MHSDSSFLFHLIARVHFHPHWAVGAGAYFGLWPTAHPELSDDAVSTDRSLSRSYLMLTGQLLYYPTRRAARAPRPGLYDYHFGLDAGMALLSDRYQSTAFDQQGALRIGEPGSTVRTEGLVARFLLGLDYGITEHLALGLGAQAGMIWFPAQKATVLGDPGTVVGAELVASGTVEFKAFLDL